MGKHFVDREQESSTILKIINECKLNTVIITASKSGIGKSTLSKKISYNLPENIQSISVHTPPINDVQQIESEYLNSVFSSFFACYNLEDKKAQRKNRKKLSNTLSTKNAKEQLKKKYESSS